MYFVVFIEALKKYTIVPSKWVFDIGNHFEKFINSSLNKNQWFLCYFTTRRDAFDDDHRPICDYVPDFDRDVLTNIDADGDFDGCFMCKLVFFSRKYFWNNVNKFK